MNNNNNKKKHTNKKEKKMLDFLAKMELKQKSLFKLRKAT